MNLKVRPVFFGTEREKARAVLEIVKEVLPSHVELAPEAFLQSWEDLSGFPEKLEGMDAILELTENIRPTAIRFFIRLGDFGLPLILYGGDYAVAPRRLEATGYWKSMGARVYFSLSRADLRDHLSLLAAKHRIEHTRALLVGSQYSSPYVVTSSPDLKKALQALGVEIRSCESARLREY